MNKSPVHYGEYLELNTIIHAQNPKTDAHEEMLFIITHQAYELWFKQILHEVNSALIIMKKQRVSPSEISVVAHRMQRVTEIQRVLNQQLHIMETMTPMEFLEFRDELVPASGFQSLQFREIETKLGLKQKFRLKADREFFKSRLSAKEQAQLLEVDLSPSLLELLDQWLSRMPYAQTDDFNFWDEYQKSVAMLHKTERDIIFKNSFMSEKEKEFQFKNLESSIDSFAVLFSDKRYTELLEKGEVRLTRKAKLAAIFIRLFRHEPVMQLPNRLLETLLDVDELFTTWRYRHAIMAQRLLGMKVGTGGSSGHDYLKRSTDNNRIYKELFALSTYLLPIEKTPKLPSDLKKKMGFLMEEN